MWLSYNPINKHKDDASLMPIFRYGVTNENDNIDENEMSGVPMIAYLHNDEFRFVFTNNLTDLSDEKYKQKYIQTIHLPPQKWNNIVFNYHNSRVDLFIN